jgi:hypothetical protein
MTRTSQVSPAGALPEKAGSVAMPIGLTRDEARRRLEKFGPNAMPETTAHPLRMAPEKFWAPVPWMLEAAIVLQAALGDYTEAAIIAVLLVFNAALGFFQTNPCRTEVSAGPNRFRSARRRVENRAGRPSGARRRGCGVEQRSWGRSQLRQLRRQRPIRSGCLFMLTANAPSTGCSKNSFGRSRLTTICRGERNQISIHSQLARD